MGFFNYYDGGVDGVGVPKSEVRPICKVPLVVGTERQLAPEELALGETLPSVVQLNCMLSFYYHYLCPITVMVCPCPITSSSIVKLCFIYLIDIAISDLYIRGQLLEC